MKEKRNNYFFFYKNRINGYSTTVGFRKSVKGVRESISNRLMENVIFERLKKINI